MLENAQQNMLPVKERIQKLSALPSLAVVKYQLIKTLNRENASIEDISEIIRHDQALASRVIAIANSAFLGYPGRIGAIDQAVMLLGFDLVRSISLAASIFNVFATQYGNFKQIWAHSYVVASIAGALCGRMDGADKGSCFLAGLLHDIGRLAMFRVISESDLNSHLHELVKLRGDELLRSEERIAGCSHTEASKWFLEHLCFPEEIIIPIQNHHMPAAEGPLKGISNTIFLAEGLSDIICPQIVHDGQWTDAHKRVFDDSGLVQKNIDDISAFIAGETSSISQFFDL